MNRKWIVAGNPYTLPSVWSEDKSECITDRVFNGHAEAIAALPEAKRAIERLLEERNAIASQLAELTGIEHTWHSAREGAHVVLAKLKSI